MYASFPIFRPDFCIFGMDSEFERLKFEGGVRFILFSEKRIFEMGYIIKRQL